MTKGALLWGKERTLHLSPRSPGPLCLILLTLVNIGKNYDEQITNYSANIGSQVGPSSCTIKILNTEPKVTLEPFF